jgi:WhiB family redox-sensing transcriptional regulator
MVDDQDESWRSRAGCTGENAVYFFPPSHFERKPEKDYREGHARALCRECPVRVVCLEYALRVGETHGIWGGLNELERRRFARRRAADAGAAASVPLPPPLPTPVRAPQIA